MFPRAACTSASVRWAYAPSHEVDLPEASCRFTGLALPNLEGLALARELRWTPGDGGCWS